MSNAKDSKSSIAVIPNKANHPAFSSIGMCIILNSESKQNNLTCDCYLEKLHKRIFREAFSLFAKIF